MADENIATYLNDHLAGAVAALELLEHLESAHGGTPLEKFFAELRAEVDADRRELEAVMRGLEVSESRTRKAAAWLTEKATELKLRLDDPAGGALRLLEALEVLALGIEGKRGMWQALESVSQAQPRLQSVDFERLTKRAEDQRGRVEDVRIEAAKSAFKA